MGSEIPFLKIESMSVNHTHYSTNPVSYWRDKQEDQNGVFCKKVLQLVADGLMDLDWMVM